MIVERNYYVKISEIGKENKITNKAILGILEDVAAVHSDMAGYGIKNMEQTRLTWILIDWKVQIIRRPNYSEKVLARTWSKNSLKCYTFRDFELLDEQGNVIAKAISRWVLVNIDTGRLEMIDDKILSNYQPELDRTVFEDESFEKLKEPMNFEHEIMYEVKRSDIDVNHHLHNINYLDLATEALPDEIYSKYGEFNNFKIFCKKEVKFRDKVRCKYAFENNKHIVIVKSEDDKKVHSIIELD